MFQLIHPRVQCQSVSMSLRENRPRAMNEQTTQIGIAALSDAQQFRIASGGVLSWDQAQPGGEVASFYECRSVSDGGYRGGRHQRPHSRDLLQSLTDRVLLRHPFDLPRNLFPSSLEVVLGSNLAWPREG